MDVAMLNEISDEVKKYNARLLPVIKGRETEEISKVYNEGFREFGENRLEELLNHKNHPTRSKVAYPPPRLRQKNNWFRKCIIKLISHRRANIDRT